MSVFLTLSFLFFTGSVAGWVLELFFRRFFSRANPTRKWINPGLCTGPYLPLYGSGLCLLYLLATLDRFPPFQSAIGRLLLILTMTAAMTALEYLSGIFNLFVLKVRLWDYSREPGNVQGVICPKFTFFWGLLAAAYYFLLHAPITAAIAWFSENLAFSFVVGLFFGVFLVDFAHALRLLTKLKQFAETNQVIIRFEHLKVRLRGIREARKEKSFFFSPFRTELPLTEHLKELKEEFESRLRRK